MAGLATLRGADRSRRPIDLIALAEQASTQALEHGSEDEEVRSTLTEFRRRLSREPLDTRTRVVYASLLLGLSRGVEDTRAATFHARTAAEFSPVTVPVVRTAALLLARANEQEDATRLAREMFSYDPRGAAELLGAMEPFIYQDQTDGALAPTAEAWLGWARYLRSEGRDEEANRRVELAYDRWPDDPDVLSRICFVVVGRGDWNALAALFPPSRELSERPEAAQALICRARSRAVSGDAEGARADVAMALSFIGDKVWAQIWAGEVHLELGAITEARRLWKRALHLMPADAGPRRMPFLLRLARLEQEYGEPAAALRFWRSVLEIDPDHEEARRGIEELTGLPR